MTAPSHSEIHVALAELRSDATHWMRTSDKLRAAAGRADAQRLDPATFSFAGQDVAAAYEALRAKLASLLTGGADVAVATAQALAASADAYEAEENQNVHRLRGIY